MILDENERPMVSVHECWSDEEAAVIKSVLRDGGVDSFLNSEVPHTVLPLNTGALGKVEVLVNEADESAAREIIQEHLQRIQPGE